MPPGSTGWLRAIDRRGAASATAFADAHVNSQFESGMKSPIDADTRKAFEVMLDLNGWQIETSKSAPFGARTMHWRLSINCELGADYIGSDGWYIRNARINYPLTLTYYEN